MAYRILVLNSTFYLDRSIVDAFNHENKNCEMVIVQDGGSFETKIFLIEPADLVKEIAVIRQITSFAHFLAWVFITIRR
jgi:hypothetical protein